MNLLEGIQKSNFVYICGCSKVGVQIYTTIHNAFPDKMIAFADNDKEKQKRRCCGCPVLPYDELINRDNSQYIIASVKHVEDIKTQLLTLGISRDSIVVPDVILYELINELRGTIGKRTPRKTMDFIVCITEHCNLNCASCDHFSPLAQEWYMQLEQFESDLIRMKQVLNEKVASIRIEGGEPLLHADVLKFIETARKVFPNVKLYLLTNGLLLRSKDARFYQICRNNNVIIRVTPYPISLDYDSLRKFILDKGIRFEYAVNNEEKTMIHQTLDLDGKQDKYDSFHHCLMANGECAELRNGKLYQCNLVANAHIFNEYFDRNLIIDKRDYIDIYSDVDAQDIFDYLCNPIMFCKYCNTREWYGGNKWKVSEHKIEEWI